MIRHLHVRGFGPHDDLSLPLEERAELVGASEAGKSTLVEAVCFALLGRASDGSRFPREWIRDGHESASVELVVDGVAVRRTVDRQGQVVRTVDSEVMKSERAFAERLGLQDHEAVRTVLAPLQWPALAQANARALRDLLGRLLPPVDVASAIAARLQAAGLELADPAEARLGEKAVSRLRRDARSARDRDQGRVEALSERLEALGPEQALPDAADPDVLARVEAWEAYDRAVAAHDAQVQTLEQARARARAWEARRAELGDAPEVPDRSVLDQAQRAERDAQAALGAARDAWRELQDRYHQAVARLKGLEKGKPGFCPTCGAEWDRAKRAISRARGLVEGMDLERDGMVERGRRAREAHEQAAAALRQVRERALERQGWDRALRALGPAPVIPEVPAAPEPPAGVRPSAAELGPAAARGAALQRRADRERVETALTDARAACSRATAECERLDALLAAVREVPSELAAQQIAPSVSSGR